MDSVILNEYLEKIEGLRGKDYLSAVVAYHIAPTIEKIKPSSIVTFNNHRRELYSLWKKYKYCFLNYYGLDFCELKSDNEQISILFFDRKLLNEVIFDNENMLCLKEFNYSPHMTLEEALHFLQERFEYAFPHEIGIFLGFPLEEVKQFIEYPERNGLLYGYWKVYENLEYAKFKFILYDRTKIKIINRILRESNSS
jgi:hypothetical protein